MSKPRILLGSDHAGYDLKEAVKQYLDKKGYPILDNGVHDHTSADYPLVAQSTMKRLLAEEADKAILVCGTGLGMCYAANRFKGIRAALCESPETARMASAHNNANVLCLGGRVLSPDKAFSIVSAWLDTPFEGGRHQRRLEQIDLPFDPK